MIIDKLREIQKREHLTDEVLAQNLGIHPISWNRVKKGRSKSEYDKALSKLKDLLEVYPELFKDIVKALSDNHNGEGK